VVSIGAVRTRPFDLTDAPATARLPRKAGRPVRRVATGRSELSVAQRFAALSPTDRRQALLSLVRDTAALALGHLDPAQITASTVFKDLGIDSLTAVELRDGLAEATGLRLPATLVFDHPTPEDVATYLFDRFGQNGTSAQDGVIAALEAARDRLPSVPVGSPEHTRIVALLRDLLRAPSDPDPQPELDSASDDDLFALVDGAT